ncbi:alanine--glyoxylate aminotransferase family protein, partial [Candidatus Woesearchaeota archaeon]|nr:alanine--glyoxylate aminotransferase family protein [Candidatus Woesearchaeota archaeon]
KTIPDKGYYFNLEVIMKNHLRNMTPSTPPISQIYALNRQLKKIFEEGPEKRFRRHEEMAHYVRDWVKMKFELFPEPGYESVTLTCARNTEEISIASLNERLQACGYTISNGYGALKEKTFRIAHMGDHTMTELKELLSIIEKEMREEK